jgi:N-acyl-D-amino-acid deacylase
MEFDLVVRNGLIVDGSGAPGRRGHVAIAGDRIVAVGDVEGAGREEIDADGLVVAPGFVDGHTHMDAQVFWDRLGTSSCWHGVTTVAMGNCGFTLAPASKDDRAFVVRNLERAEDIAPEAIAEGITWTWSTFSEYLDAVDAQPKGLNYVAAVGHSALRTWAMGERAFEEPATENDLAVMEVELRHALHAGAAGFTTSRSESHATSDDRPVASRLATWDEVVALVGLVGRESSGIFEISGEPASVGDPEGRRDYHQRLQQLALSSGVPTVFGIFASPTSSGMLPVIEDTVARGGHMYGLTHCRGVSTLQSFAAHLSFDRLPEWQDLRSRPLDAQRKLLQDPDLRKRLVEATHGADYGQHRAGEARTPNYNEIQVMYSPYLPNPTVAEEAARRGLDPAEAMIEISLENDLNIFFAQMIVWQRDEDQLVKLLRHPNTAMTFSDSGAHISRICDASIQTHLLAYWVRERQALTLEEAIRMITYQPAQVWRLHDRGLLAPGYAADVTIFDAATVAPLMPRVVYDLPGGARRLVQEAEGYAATIVNGQVFTRNGEASEARPGRLLRAGSIPVPG